MADTSVVANSGVGGAAFKADADAGAVLWPYSKQAWGPSGTQNEVDDAVGKRLPVKLAEVGAVTVPVSAAALPLPTGASTAAKQPALGTAGAASTDVLTVQGIAAMTPLKVDGSAVTQPISVAGTVAVTESGTWTVQPGNTPNSTPWLQSLIPAASGGLSDYHVVAGSSTNAANVKASAGQLYGWSIFNNAAYSIYVKLHNTAGAPTAGVGVVKTIGVPPGGGSNIDIANGLAFGTGIGITIVKGIADADATAVVASDCVVDLHYK